MNVLHSVKVKLKIDQLQTLINHAQEEADYWLTFGQQSEAEEWARIRDEFAYEMDMITQFPFKK